MIKLDLNQQPKAPSRDPTLPPIYRPQYYSESLQAERRLQVTVSLTTMPPAGHSENYSKKMDSHHYYFSPCVNRCLGQYDQSHPSFRPNYRARKKSAGIYQMHKQPHYCTQPVAGSLLIRLRAAGKCYMGPQKLAAVKGPFPSSSSQTHVFFVLRNRPASCLPGF